LDVVGTKVTFTPPPFLSKSGLKLVCNVNVVFRNLKLRTLKVMTRKPNKLYVHEFGFRTIKSKISKLCTQ
jgi:hypothetical protein